MTSISVRQITGISVPDAAVDSVLYQLTHRQQPSMDGIPLPVWTATVTMLADTTWNLDLTAEPAMMLGYRVDGTHGRGTGISPIAGTAGTHLPADLDPVCVVCGTRRARTHYLLTAPDGALTVVGATCLDSFFHTVDPSLRGTPQVIVDTMLADPRDQIARRVTYLTQIAPKWDTLHVLAAALHYHRDYDRPIKIHADHHLSIVAPRDRDNNPVWVASVENHLLDAALLQAWAITEDTDDSDFAHAARRAVIRPYATKSDVALLASLPARYARARRIEKAHAAGAPNPFAPYTAGHLGEVGQKITVEHAILDQLRLLDSGSTLLVLRAPSGHRLTWFSSNPPARLEVGSYLSLTGTVKAHATFRGVDATQLTRCRVTVE